MAEVPASEVTSVTKHPMTETCIEAFKFDIVPLLTTWNHSEAPVLSVSGVMVASEVKLVG